MLEPKELLNLYKEETEKILKSVKKEEFDALDIMFNKRQQIIDELKNYNLNLYKKKFDEEIAPLEEKLKSVMEEKKNYFKKEILKMKSQRSANRAYNSSFFNNNFFNKKI